MNIRSLTANSMWLIVRYLRWCGIAFEQHWLQNYCVILSTSSKDRRQLHCEYCTKHRMVLVLATTESLFLRLPIPPSPFLARSCYDVVGILSSKPLCQASCQQHAVIVGKIFSNVCSITSFINSSTISPFQQKYLQKMLKNAVVNVTRGR